MAYHRGGNVWRTNVSRILKRSNQNGNGAVIWQAWHLFGNVAVAAWRHLIRGGGSYQRNVAMTRASCCAYW